MNKVLELVDTHCHIQFPDYPVDPIMAIKDAGEDGVNKMIVVGCALEDSKAAVEFAMSHKNVWSSIGLHPHEGARYVHDHNALSSFRGLAEKDRVIAIGETGLDYYHQNSSKKDQEKLLRFQLDLAQEFKKPLIFHVREAFDDFWKILDGYKGINGVVHSFSSGIKDLENILTRELYVGLNGIMTFTKKPEQLEAAKMVPKDRLVLETDAPFLTPSPLRGKICEPKHVRITAEFLAELRGEELLDLAKNTTNNVKRLFNI